MQKVGAPRAGVRSRFIAAMLAAAIAVMLVLVPAPYAGAAELTSTIDFDSGLSSGDTPSSLSVGSGMSGADLGYVTVTGTNPLLSGNQAMIYDSSCGGQTVPVSDPAWDPTACSDDDSDLYIPGQGNSLIISEDGNSAEPDDYAGFGGFFTFDFANWGPGVVRWVQLTMIDLEGSGASVELYDTTGTLVATVPITPTGGDNTTAVTIGDVDGVRTIIVVLNQSGAVDDIEISTEIPLIDLEVAKSVDDASVLVGEQVTFTVSVTNQGPDPATGVEVTDTLPAGLSYVSHVTATGSFDAGSGVWTIGGLGVSETVSMDLTVTVDAAGSFTNEAEVTAANEDDVDSTPGDGEGDDWDDETVEASEVLASGLIGDFVWSDEDKDGVQDAGEEGVAGVTIRLTNTGTNAISTQVTNADGLYLFSALDPGTYLVEILMATAPEMTALTTTGSYTVALAEDEQFLTADFGIAGSLPKTGLEIPDLTGVGLVLLMTGAGLLALTTRRRYPLGIQA